MFLLIALLALLTVHVTLVKLDLIRVVINYVYPVFLVAILALIKLHVPLVVLTIT